ncbi:MAG: undecaprenyl-diphosphate phosphatase [Clostridia bacterium]|nr:undecaprenyl-diphosphate phosphatase [Clostridia bacterium]
MTTFFEILKALLFGIVEGITEWLPVSSTGHLILLHEFVNLKSSEAFNEMFDVVIQLGAILAVIILYFKKLNPFALSKSVEEKKGTWSLWFKVCVAVVPSAVIGLLFDDILDAYLYNAYVVSAMLILYGIFFILIERKRSADSPNAIETTSAITYKAAFLVGMFQMLALIPGTSRSGATILGALLLGFSRGAAAEFSFFMAIPTMAGASLLKAVKFVLDGNSMSSTELIVLVTAFLSAFAVSLVAIKYLTDYVKKHTFSAFGIYRIVLGALVLIFFLGKLIVKA